MVEDICCTDNMCAKIAVLWKLTEKSIKRALSRQTCQATVEHESFVQIGEEIK